ncbi:MAG: hypothetical protein D6753_02950 [Planctomycetota bacterium]|nr:MAG: hypothetical protein D6753_02950 [Planctomycetota bacterium]
MCLHWVLIVLALSSNLAPSMLQGMLLEWTSPYLYATHQAYGAVPLEITHGESIDRTLLVETQDEHGTWWPVDLGQQMPREGELRWTKSRWSQVSRVFRIIANELSDAEILAEVALALVRHQEATLGKEVHAVRLIEMPVPSYDEYMAVADDGPAALVEVIDPQVIYQASVARRGELILGVTPVLPEFRVARPGGGGS